ncbi:MAG: type II toxin-antitoxin system RelE/ParE family toxin [Burkholderiales bacterium]|nr:type II toxin-antitoxin system RelE/ParE family toxin [Burkholderiales bacterium]
MSFKVLWLASAERDLAEIADYIAEHDSPASATHVVESILDAANSLTRFPEAGTYPHELAGLGNHEYRQVFFKPYRLMYRIVKMKVYVYLVADGRRDMHGLLARRLLK